MKLRIFAIVAAILALGCMGVGLVASNVCATDYYTQIDNTKLREVNSRGGVIDIHGGLPYAYTLPAYDENGGAREITFGTSRELRDTAFLCLTVLPLRGVVSWREVTYAELPDAVQQKFVPPQTEQTESGQ